MLNKNLPQDLKKFVRSQIIQKITIFALCVLAYSFILFFFGKIILHTDNLFSVLVFWLLGVGILAAILRIPALIADKTICGTVAKTIIKTEDTKALTAGLGTLQQKHVIDLIITTSDGKTHYKNISSVEDKTAVRASLSRYKEGDTVFHLRGTPHTILIPKESDLSVQCAVCGRANDISLDTCEKCNHTLIKSL